MRAVPTPDPSDAPRVDILNFNFYDWDGERPIAGGAERYVLELARLIAALGLRPRLVQNARRPFARRHEGIEVVGVVASPTLDLARMSEGFRDAVAGASLVIASPVELAARLYEGTLVVGINHGIHWDYPNNRVEVHDPARDAAIVAAVRRCAACVCVDANFPNWLRCLDGTAAARTRRIANFVDLDTFRPADKSFDGRLTVLFPRRLCRERGFHDVVEAFDALLPRHDALDLHLCGEGGAAEEALAEAFAARHPGRVRRSRLALDAMPAAYAASHVVVVPTLFAEGTSLSCLEAMATRNAVVTTAVGGLPELVVDEWNALFQSPGAAGLAEALERLLADRAYAARLAANALTTVTAYARERWLARWQQVLHDALPARVPAPAAPAPPTCAPQGLEAAVARVGAERDAALAAADAERAARTAVAQQFHWAAGELAGIKASTGWAVLQQMYRVRFALFPRGSRREAWAKRLMHEARRHRGAGQGALPVAPAAAVPVPPALPAPPAPPAGQAPPQGQGHAPPRRPRPLVVCLPILEWSFRFQRPQQLARCQAAAGHDVLFAQHSFGDALAVQPIERGIEALTLPGPRGANPYRDRLDEADAQAMAQALLAHLDARGAVRFVVVVQLPFWAPLALRLRALAGCDVVYDCMDLHEGFASNTAAALSDESRLLREADLVVVSSQKLLDHARPHARALALVRNGVDHAHFAAVPDRRPAPGAVRTVGYYGAIADWFDSALVAGIAALRPHWRIVLVGSTWSADVAPLEAASNVLLTGERPYAELPALIADWDACIIPFRHTPLTEATNPVKVYEMLAAGKPVVSVGLPELADMAREGLVAAAEGAPAFVEAIERALGDDDAQRAQARRAFAARNTWTRRQQAFDAAVEALTPLVSIVIVTYNNRALNELCLASVLHDTDWPALDVIVVDNASRDGTPDLLREAAARDARVRIVLNDDNRGFSAANNQGAALARGAYLCFLNNDTVVHGGWLRTLVGHLRREAGLGLVGPVTNAIGNEAKIPVGYDDLAGFPAWMDAHCAAHRGRLDPISMLAFFCVVLPRDVWRRVGPLDERFGAGMFEDDDYNRRVRDAGYDVRLARDSFVHHWQRASFKLLGEEEYLRIYRENEARYAQKWAEPAPDALAPLRRAAAAAKATVVFAPSVGWDIPLAQRPHHMARVLAADGCAVVFDCTNAADPVDTLHEAAPGLFLYKGAPEALAALPRLVVWTFSYNVGYRDAFPAEARWVYDWIDDLAVFPYDQRALAAMHARALREADVVASVARPLHAQALRARPDALYVPNAVESGRFEREPAPNPALADPAFAAVLAAGRPVAGYYGALAHWFDYPLLAEAARRRPDWSFVLIGPDHDGSLARSGVAALPNVHALGPRPYASLPGYLHRFDVATIPFALNDITRATSPLKLYEYFAAGRPVVSAPMPECMAYPEVRIAGDAAAFAQALDAARADGRDPAHVAKLRALAEANTWRERTRVVMDAVQAARAQPRA